MIGSYLLSSGGIFMLEHVDVDSLCFNTSVLNRCNAKESEVMIPSTQEGQNNDPIHKKICSKYANTAVTTKLVRTQLIFWGHIHESKDIFLFRQCWFATLS